MDFATTKDVDNIFLGHYPRAQFVLTSEDGKMGTHCERWIIMVQMKGVTVCFKQVEIPKLMFETNLGWSSFSSWALVIYSAEAWPSAECSLTGLMPAVAEATILVAVWLGLQLNGPIWYGSNHKLPGNKVVTNCSLYLSVWCKELDAMIIISPSYNVSSKQIPTLAFMLVLSFILKQHVRQPRTQKFKTHQQQNKYAT